MVDDSLKSILDDEKINKALKTRVVNDSVFQNKNVIQSIGDVTETRKKWTTKLNNLGKARDLNGKLVNGISTIAGVFLNEKDKELKISNIEVFSNGNTDFVSKEEMKLYRDNKLNDKKREQEIQKAIQTNKAHNLTDIINNHFKTQSQIAKDTNSDITVIHTYDRGADSKEHFSYMHLWL